MKTVVTDLDGTLLDNGELSNKTIEVLKEFQKDNHLILATGRNLKSVEHIYKQLDMNKYQTGGLILLNGLEFYDFSDGENDIEMLKYAYNSYAPIGCLDKAKLVAKHDCASCKDDGVARVVSEIMNGEEVY